MYWDHFEMEIKEALLGAFVWVEPDLYDAVRRVLNVTFLKLRKAYRHS